MNYYDCVLGTVPLLLVGVSGALYSAGVEMTTAVPVGGLFSMLVIAHALFASEVGQVDHSGEFGPDRGVN